jgi:sigma-B regulation protein RsbU (phosphoserine phosphatase)
MAYSGKVLVIDDDAQRARDLAALTAAAGFQPTVSDSRAGAAGDGAPHALQQLGEGSDWDVVLCGVHAITEADWSRRGCQSA